MKFSIKVVDHSGNPRKGINVMVDFGFMNGTSTQYTNGSGWANFNTSGSYVSMEILVDGKSRGHHSISEGQTYSFVV